MSHHVKKKNVRLTIDISANQHTYIKMLAMAEGISLREFVIAYLPRPEESSQREKHILKKKFKKILKEFLSQKPQC